MHSIPPTTGYFDLTPYGEARCSCAEMCGIEEELTIVAIFENIRCNDRICPCCQLQDLELCKTIEYLVHDLTRGVLSLPDLDILNTKNKRSDSKW
jgi:hypothetical protein